MANYITIETTDAVRGKILVNPSRVISVMPGDLSVGGLNMPTRCAIFQNFDDSTDFSGIELTVAGDAATGGEVVANAIIAAIVANPGGQVAAVRLPDGVTITDVQNI